MIDHHAVVYTTPTREAFLMQLQSKTKSVEWLVYQQDVLSIADVRRVIEQAYQRPATETYRVIAIVVRSIAVEAQHALLKIIEEPPVTTRFIFILPSVAGLLPTVLSRVYLAPVVVNEGSLASIQSFMSCSIPERLEQIAGMAKRKDDKAFNDLQASLITLLEQPQSIESSVRATLAPLLIYLRIRGAAKKMIWEEIALSLPIAK